MQSRLAPTTRGAYGTTHSEIEQLFDRMLSTVGLSPLSGSRLNQIGGVSQSSISIPVDVTETENAYLVIAEVPGLTERDVDVTVSGENLIIRGHRQHQSQLGGGQGGQTGTGTSTSQQTGGQRGGQQGGQQGHHYHVIERSYGEFIRTFTLPQNVDRDQIQAEFTNGLLTITLPKTPESQKQQRRIEVKAGQPNQNR